MTLEKYERVMKKHIATPEEWLNITITLNPKKPLGAKFSYENILSPQLSLKLNETERIKIPRMYLGIEPVIAFYHEGKPLIENFVTYIEVFR
jgi:hypothetical protein